MEITSDITGLIARLQKRVENFQPSNPRLKQAFTRIGLYVSAITKLNVRRRGLIDTGRLMNSIRYEFTKDAKGEGIQVGSFGVPYAAVHEFGFNGRVNVRAFTRRGKPVQAHSRNVRIRQRPYLRPALAHARLFILDTLREALK
jgi:phage gpG-like protein